MLVRTPYHLTQLHCFCKTSLPVFFSLHSGSGKTYTMKPLPLKASRDILRLMHHTYRNQGFQLFVSFFEIYGGKLYDLLSDRKLVDLPFPFLLHTFHFLNLLKFETSLCAENFA
jgi:hypothetical protein